MLTLVTGATGTVGRHVVEELATAEVPVRAAIRAEADLPPGAVEFDFSRPATWAGALEGVDRMFLMRPPAMSDVKRELRPFLGAAAAASVRHVVFLSVQGVNRVMPHWQVERDLEASGMTHTFLRPSFFTQNLSMAYRDDIALHDRLRLPAGNGRTTFIDTRDVAAVAALALRDPAAHAGAAYTLTGPDSRTYGEVADVLTRELGRPIRYERVGFLRYRSELRAQGFPAAYVRIQLVINAVARAGLAGRMTEEFTRLTGRPARALPESVHDLRAAWSP